MKLFNLKDKYSIIGSNFFFHFGIKCSGSQSFSAQKASKDKDRNKNALDQRYKQKNKDNYTSQKVALQ